MHVSPSTTLCTTGGSEVLVGRLVGFLVGAAVKVGTDVADGVIVAVGSTNGLFPEDTNKSAKPPKTIKVTAATATGMGILMLALSDCAVLCTYLGAAVEVDPTMPLLSVIVSSGNSAPQTRHLVAADPTLASQIGHTLVFLYPETFGVFIFSKLPTDVNHNNH